MSHQTGIKANDKLQKFLSKCRDGKIRTAKISICDEELVLDSSNEVKKDWESDFEKLVPPLIEENQPCYILFRFDTKNSSGYEWLFISWSPDSAPVRQKMLYASTKATLKQEFGTAQIKDELHATISSDLTLNGYQKHEKAAQAPAPLTMREEELQDMRKTHVHTDYSVDSKQQTLTGVGFPIDSKAKQGIIDMANGLYDYLQFKINLEEEMIYLACAEQSIAIDKLPGKVPADEGRYHLFKFRHTHEGDYMENFVFIYSMPGYKCSVKERMLYSSCKRPFTTAIENLGLEMAKSLEIDSGDELTEKYLYEEIHPVKNLHRPKFDKPKGPPNRGPKRMTKAVQN